MSNKSQQIRSVTRPASNATVLIGAVLLVLGAATFVVTSTTASIAALARDMHRLDELQRLVEADRSFIATATHFNALRSRLEWDLDDEIETVLDQSTAVEEDIEALLAEATTNASAPVEEFLAEAERIRTAIDAEDMETSQELLERDFADGFASAASVVSSLRDEQLARLVAIDQRGARVSDAARFIVVLFVPLAIVLVYREIIQRQARSRQLELQLEAEKKLAEARDEFVANASHELRTPLTGILGISEIVAEDPRIPRDVAEMLQMVTGEAADLSRMVEDLLTTARLSAGQLRYEPRRVATQEEGEVVVRPFLGSGKRIVLDVDDGAVFVDRLRQRQVLRNLVSNAVKYGGDTVRLEGKVEGLWFRWVVADNGDGVPEELERRLFQKFVHSLTFQQAVAGGVGLGLSIVKSLADGMGGSVEYRRFDGETQFIVMVPIADGLPGSRPSIHAAGGLR